VHGPCDDRNGLCGSGLLSVGGFNTAGLVFGLIWTFLQLIVKKIKYAEVATLKNKYSVFG
jgi:hypothetical protein